MPDKNIQLTPPLSAPEAPAVKRPLRSIMADYVYLSSRPSRNAVIFRRW
jgi:hypothetical protein